LPFLPFFDVVLTAFPGFKRVCRRSGDRFVAKAARKWQGCLPFLPITLPLALPEVADGAMWEAKWKESR
jgi:hypothetical protein